MLQRVVITIVFILHVIGIDRTPGSGFVQCQRTRNTNNGGGGLRPRVFESQRDSVQPNIVVLRPTNPSSRQVQRTSRRAQPRVTTRRQGTLRARQPNARRQQFTRVQQGQVRRMPTSQRLLLTGRPFRPVQRQTVNGPGSGVRMRFVDQRLQGLRPAGTRCAPPLVFRCRRWPSNRDPRNAQMCYDSNCRSRQCAVRCYCACVNLRQRPRVRNLRRNMSQRRRNRTNTGQRARPSGARARTPAGRVRGAGLAQSGSLDFGLSDSVLASVLAEPTLTSLVGPQGINSILNGEPPALLPSGSTGRDASALNGGGQISPAVTTHARDTIRGMGIPIPMNAAPPSDAVLASLIGEDLNLEGAAKFLSAPTGNRGINSMNLATMGGRVNVQPAAGSAHHLSDSLFDAILGMQNRPDHIPFSNSTVGIDKSRSGNSRIRAPNSLIPLSNSIKISPSLISSGVIRPSSSASVNVINNDRTRRPKAGVHSLDSISNAVDGAVSQFDAISDIISGNIPDRETIGRSGLNFASDMSILRDVIGGESPSDVALMASMMQSIGGAVDAVAAANSRNSSAARGAAVIGRPSAGLLNRPIKISRNIKTGQTNNKLNAVKQQQQNGTAGQSISNFLAGAVKATDVNMRGPTKDECLLKRLELWCDPVSPWEDTPGLPHWCLLNCRTNNCDRKRCMCSCISSVSFKRNSDRLPVL